MIKNLFILFCVFASVSSESCKAFQIKKEHLNKRLIGHEIAEMIVKGHHECVRECFYLSLCKSTDYYKRENTCKLNDADSKSVETTEFEDKPGAVFSDITEWPSGMAGVCGQRPCSEIQKCFPDKGGHLCREVCGRVPTIENGVVTLNKAGAMLYMDTATVTCHEGYRADKPSIKCQASGTWESVSCEKITDCKDIHQYFPSMPSGAYGIKFGQSLDWLSVYCDMDTDGGGWTVFQSRFNGSVNFYRNFSEYENGFGNLDTEFWLGLKYVQEMASQGQTELRMDLTAADGSVAYENFQNFYLDKGPEYTLHIDPGTGTAGDDVLQNQAFSFHNGQHFTTYDVDRDQHTVNCAVLARGGWWYDKCGGVNPNGEYVTPGTEHPSGYLAGMIYYQFKGGQSLKTTKMMFRRV